MRIERRLVFDDWVYGSARTSFVHDDFFGRFDQLAVHVLLTKYDLANGSLIVTAEQSGDGEYWVPILNSVAVGTVLPVPYNPFAGALQGAQLGFVRLLIELRGRTTSGRVRMVVTGRDRGAWAEVEREVEIRQQVEEGYSNPDEHLGSTAPPEPVVDTTPYDDKVDTTKYGAAVDTTKYGDGSDNYKNPGYSGPDDPYHPN